MTVTFTGVGLAGVIAGVTILAVIGSLGQGSNDFGFPPTVAECAEAWNEPGNRVRQATLAGGGYEAAVVEGWQAKSRFGYCSVAFLEHANGGAWRFYVRWVSGFERFHEAAQPWTLDVRGERWGIDNPDSVTPSPNARVQRGGRVNLTEG